MVVLVRAISAQMTRWCTRAVERQRIINIGFSLRQTNTHTQSQGRIFARISTSADSTELVAHLSTTHKCDTESVWKKLNRCMSASDVCNCMGHNASYRFGDGVRQTNYLRISKILISFLLMHYARLHITSTTTTSIHIAPQRTANDVKMRLQRIERLHFHLIQFLGFAGCA